MQDNFITPVTITVFGGGDDTMVMTTQSLYYLAIDQAGFYDYILIVAVFRVVLWLSPEKLVQRFGFC